MNAHVDDLPLLSRLLDEALGLEPDRVDAWLAQLPPEQAPLVPALRKMLALHRMQGHATFMASGPRLEGAPPDDVMVRAGELVGPYRLIREIGRGGMGAVWLAERADGTLKRQVALKLPRLAGGAYLAEHMARERDIGALLEHPHIARLYDAGVDAQGRPYLALEHVDGQSVDAWCRSRSLGVAERLRLVLQIARAVAYAHGRLVVHRDLKPSNVLVTPDGQAHLLDFGIARLLQVSASPPGEPRPAPETEQALTPRYASPEQLRGEAVTVASDVYALGVLMFELLTGSLPHEPLRNSVAALQAAVLEHDAPAASSRASDAATAQALRGELDAIVAKALQRRPEDRYATADAFAEDIERQLAGERVLAMPDSVAYRFAKTWQRHRVGLAAAAAVLLAVLAGTGVALVQARRATEAADRARLVKEFVIDIFKVSHHGRPANAELRQLPVELLLERGTKLIESKHPGQAPLQAELYGVVGGIFAGMGADEQAAQHATRQLEAQVALGAPATEQAQATLLLAQSLAALGRLGEAQTMARSALALAGSDPLLQPRIHLLLAQVLLQQGSRDEGVRQLDEALHEMEGRPGLAVDTARAKALRASLLVFEERIDAARPIWQSAIADALAAEGPLSPTAIDIHFVAAGNLAQQGLADEARAHREAALAALRASGGAGELRAALEEAQTSQTLFLQGRQGFDETRETIERSRAAVAARGTLVPARIRATLDFQLGTAYLVWGDLAHADPLIADSVAVLGQPGASLPERIRQANVQAIAAMLAGRHDQADAFLRDELDAQRAIGDTRQRERTLAPVRRALNRSMQGRFDEAEAMLAALPATSSDDSAGELRQRALARVKLDRGETAAALALLPAADTDEVVPYPFDPLQLRGEVLCERGLHAEGLALLDKSLALHAGSSYEHSPHLARAHAVAGLCALAAGQGRRALEQAALARAALLDQPSAGAYFRKPSERLVERLKGPVSR